MRTFNAAIPGIVQSKVNAGKQVHLVDMHSALTTADLIDGIHPTAGGYDKMAARWYSALQSVPGALVPPVVSPSPTAPTSPSPSNPGGGTSGCRVSDTVNAWNTGLTENLTITNTGTSTINGWSLEFTLPSDRPSPPAGTPPTTHHRHRHRHQHELQRHTRPRRRDQHRIPGQPHRQHGRPHRVHPQRHRLQRVVTVQFLSSPLSTPSWRIR